jgi:hypothetical protein
MNLLTVDLDVDAAAEARRLRESRARAHDDDDAAFGWRVGLTFEPLVKRARSTAARRALAGRALLLFRVSWLDGQARVLESRLIAVLVPWQPSSPALRDRDRVLGGVADAAAAAGSQVEREAARLDSEAAEVIGRRAAARLDRERAIAGRARAPRSLVQSGLFDRRAERAHQRDAAARAEQERLLDDRLRAATCATVHSRTIELALALVP